MQIVVLFNPLINNTPFIFNQRMQMIITLKKHKKQRFFIIVFNDGLSLFTTNKWEHKAKDLKPRVLNLGSNIKENILWNFFFSYFLEKKFKNSKLQQLFFLMLETKHDKQHLHLLPLSCQTLQINFILEFYIHGDGKV